MRTIPNITFELSLLSGYIIPVSNKTPKIKVRSDVAKFIIMLAFKFNQLSPLSSFLSSSPDFFLSLALKVKLNGTLTQHFTFCPPCIAGLN